MTRAIDGAVDTRDGLRPSHAIGLIDAVRRTSATVLGARSRHVHRVRYGDASVHVGAVQDMSVVLNLSEAHRARRRSEGRVMAADPFVGAMTLVPPGYPATFELSGMARVLILQLPWTVVRRIASEDGRDPDGIELLPRLAYDDPALAGLLYTALSADGEKLVEPIVHRLIAAHAARPDVATRHVGGLPPPKLRRVCDRIEAALAEPPTLGSLAAEAGLSPSHFAREFRRVKGMSPHRYILRRQLDRATILLADRSLAVMDVAVATGFSHASHLARHLRRRTGLSPAAFRTNVLL